MADQELIDFVPHRLIERLADRIKAGVVDAEEKFWLNAADEDSLTGALGHSISTTHPVYLISGETEFAFEITSHKIGGRGPNAPEKTLGADAIFQIRVYHYGTPVFSKGLPIQAKVRGGFENQAVVSQARAMESTAGTGIVVRYSENGYTATPAGHVTKRAAIGHAPAPRPKKLATVLGGDFLQCQVGRVGLHLNPEQTRPGGAPVWVIDTIIRADLRPDDQ
jgi:hypothetical protein